MLKIKDNVDLKELEKYGYIKDNFLGYIKVEYESGNWSKVLVQIKDDKTIKINAGSKEHIDDLIKADLVEKVEEE